MRRFWINFQLPPEPEQPATGFRLDGDPWSWLRRGVGVTAADPEDALAIIHAELGRYGEIPEPAEVIHDVDVSTLDEDHILPNIGPVVWRGVWWPPGFTRWKEQA